MEIVNSKEIKKIVSFITFLIALFTVVPITIYLLTFQGNLSDSQSVWGAFGDYFGGIIGTLFNLIAVIFSLVGIYITLKIATRIHENEQNFNRENMEREINRFTKETELIEMQNRPFPHLDFNTYYNHINIILSNQGPGTLIIKDWKIMLDGKEYKHFGELIKTHIKNPEYGKFSILWERTSKMVISSGASKLLFEIEKSEHDHEIFEKFIKDCKQLIKKCVAKYYYEDIFENKYEIEEDLNH